MSPILFRHAAAQVTRRAFSATALARKDLVQDLYLKEIKAYKPKPAAADAHVGTVKPISIPEAPKAPAVSTSDLAAQLSAYDAAEPSKAEVKVEAAAPGEITGGAEAFLEALEADEVEVAHH